MKDKTKKNGEEMLEKAPLAETPLKTDVYETKDIVTATYLKVNGLYCIGTVPANNPIKPYERLWIFEYTADLQKYLDELIFDDPLVPIRETFIATSILKNLLNDRDE